MTLIIGLGNPGGEYALTRHNAGFMLVDMLSAEYGIGLSVKGKGLRGSGRIAGEEVTLLKPLTYMNRSGHAVSEFIQASPLGPEKIIVVFDDCDLPLGKIRIRGGGGSGGHKGLASIIEALGTRDIPRIRLGVGRPDEGDVVDFVLSPFQPSELPVVDEMLGRARDAVESMIACGIAQAMNKHNN
ncbi:MAG: aminoacyl-tRNA hydrolase [Deltaproteobacteria bacterium]|nr:aminoacyl-tRNA hydrolase [Deltaproteobacteria bacterium]MCL4874653.1 aminoacyl-tRNA hydrolase [bacterium]